MQITSDFMGVVPSSYPVDLIHLFTSGPQEAIIQVAVKPDTPRGEALRERIRADLRRELPDCQVSFEAADIVSQVMSFGSPTPIEVAVQGASLANDYGYAQKIQAQLAKLSFVRDLQFAQEYNYPTLDININRDRAGQFGLTMADVVRSVVPATSSSRFTRAELLARSEFRQCVPDSGGAAAESHAERRKRRSASRSCWTATGTRELDQHRADEAGDHAGAD